MSAHAPCVGGECGRTFAPGRSDLMQPHAGPLDRRFDRVSAWLVGLEMRGRERKLATVEFAEQHAPIGAAGVEAVKPVLTEIKRQVLYGVEAEHRETGW